MSWDKWEAGPELVSRELGDVFQTCGLPSRGFLLPCPLPRLCFPLTTFFKAKVRCPWLSLHARVDPCSMRPSSILHQERGRLGTRRMARAKMVQDFEDELRLPRDTDISAGPQFIQAKGLPCAPGACGRRKLYSIQSLTNCSKQRGSWPWGKK